MWGVCVCVCGGGCQRGVGVRTKEQQDDGQAGQLGVVCRDGSARPRRSRVGHAAGVLRCCDRHAVRRPTRKATSANTDPRPPRLAR